MCVWFGIVMDGDSNKYCCVCLCFVLCDVMCVV